MPIIHFFLQYLALIVSLVVHEFMHGFVAHLLGDDTAERSGRLTLNPVAHADLMGTVVLPLATMAASLGSGGLVPVFGWAKPVPYNPYNLRDQKWDAVKIALAGPLSNFALAAIFLLSLRLTVGQLGLNLSNLLVYFLAQLAVINIVLGMFNLLPVPPLDGSKLLRALLTHPKHRDLIFTLETRGPQILLLIIVLDAFSPISILGTIFRAGIGFGFNAFGL